MYRHVYVCFEYSSPTQSGDAFVSYTIFIGTEIYEAADNCKPQ